MIQRTTRGPPNAQTGSTSNQLPPKATYKPALAKAGVDDDCLQELRWLYDRRDLIEARRDLAAWLAKWSGKYSKLTGWVEENIEETLTPAFARAGSFIGCRASTISISNRPTCWNA